MVFLILVSSMSENPSVPEGDRKRSFFAGAAATCGAAGVVTFGAGGTGTGTSKTGAGRKPLFFMYFSTSLRNEKAESSVEFKDKISFQFLLHFLDNLIFKARSSNKNERKSKTYQRTIRRDQRKKFKHERKFSLPRSLSIDVNWPLPFQNSAMRPRCGNFTNFKLVQF